MPKIANWQIKKSAGNSNYPYSHTVRKSQIKSENSNFRKNLKFWIFKLKSHDFWGFLKEKFTWIIWIFRAKKSWFRSKIENNWILTIFGAKISNLMENYSIKSQLILLSFFREFIFTIYFTLTFWRTFIFFHNSYCAKKFEFFFIHT